MPDSRTDPLRYQATLPADGDTPRSLLAALRKAYFFWTLFAVFAMLTLALLDGIALSHAARLYIAGVLASQCISNVPAAILLAEYSRNWQALAYAVNVGGFGFMLGSLANLIALRMARDGKAWMVFHAYSIPFLLIAGSLAYLWLFIV